MAEAERSIWASVLLGPEARKAGMLLFRQKLGCPKGRRRGEECLCNTAGCVQRVGWGRVWLQRRSEGTEIAVTQPERSEGTELVWHRCTLKELAEPGGHGDVGIAGPDVGDAGGEAYLWGRAALLLDRVSLGDLPSTAAGEPRQGPSNPDTRPATVSTQAPGGPY